MEAKKQQIMTLILLFAAPLFLIGVSMARGEDDPQGYGYGYGACTADAPTNLHVKNQPRHHRVLMQWKKVTFENCESPKADYYDLQITNATNKVLFSFSNVKKIQKVAPISLFKPNRKYRFTVRAVAVNENATDYATSKLFTVAPKRPGLIAIEHRSSGAVRASWKNIPRAKKLKYYRVVLKRGKAVILDTKVRNGLSKIRTGITLQNLTPNTSYTLLVRSFRAKGVRSLFRTRIFRTLP